MKAPRRSQPYPLADGQVPYMNVIVADPLAANYLTTAITTAGSAAEGAASRKDNTYSAIAYSHVFVPLFIETVDPINFKGLKFLSELGDRLTATTDYP